MCASVVAHGDATPILEASEHAFDDIEMFCNPTRKHAWSGMLSSVAFERKHKVQSEGVWKTREGFRCHKHQDHKDFFRKFDAAPDWLFNNC